MGAINEIRELTGLSQAKLAAWLGVSKSLVQFAEKGERSLPRAASLKLNAIILVLQQVKKAGKVTKAGIAEFSNPEKLASRHKRKMEFHQRSALGLRIQLRKLKALHLQLHARLALFDAMKDINLEWYRATARDKKWVEFIEWFSKERMPAAGPEQQELIQDKIDMHLAYVELHRKRWERYEGILGTF